MSNIYMQIPCAYEEDTLHIKSLGMSGKGWPQEEAFFNALKANPELYAELCAGIIETDFRGKMFIAVPYSKKLYDRVFEIEPLPYETTIKKARPDFLVPTNEETLKYGF